MCNVTYLINNLASIMLITFSSFLVHIVRLDHMYLPISCCVSIVNIICKMGYVAFSAPSCAVWHCFHGRENSVNFKLVHPN